VRDAEASLRGAHERLGRAMVPAVQPRAVCEASCGCCCRFQPPVRTRIRAPILPMQPRAVCEASC